MTKINGGRFIRRWWRSISVIASEAWQSSLSMSMEQAVKLDCRVAALLAMRVRIDHLPLPPSCANVRRYFLQAGDMKRILTLTIILALTACSAKVNNGGYVSDTPVKDQVTVGKTTQDEARALLGSPSMQSSFGPEAWYYVTDRQEAYAFLKPRVVQQDVTRIEFDTMGIVSKVETYTKKDGEDIRVASRTTPTEGHTLGFFEQLLGNIGRFNAPSKDTSAPGRKPGN